MSLTFLHGIHFSNNSERIKTIKYNHRTGIEIVKLIRIRRNPIKPISLIKYLQLIFSRMDANKNLNKKDSFFFFHIVYRSADVRLRMRYRRVKWNWRTEFRFLYSLWRTASNKCIYTSLLSLSHSSYGINSTINWVLYSSQSMRDNILSTMPYRMQRKLIYYHFPRSHGNL